MRYPVWLLVFAGLWIRVSGQTIPAGMHDAGDRYVDLDPDVVFSDQINNDSATFSIDLTGDGVEDLHIVADLNGSQAYSQASIGIVCSDQTRIASTVPDCGNPCSGIQARSFAEGSSIDRYCQWDTSASTWLEGYWTYMGQEGCNCQFPGPYFGTRYVHWGDTLYGWVHIDPNMSGGTVFSFACELPTNAGIAPLEQTVSMRYAYNAAFNRLDVHFGTSLYSGCTTQLFDLQGRAVLHAARSSVVDVMRISLEEIPTGTYVFAIVSDSGSRYQGKFAVLR